MSKDVVVKSAKDLEIDQSGRIVAKNLEERLMLAKSWIDSGMLPKSYTQPSQVVTAMQMAAEVGLSPGISTLRRTANINGTPSFYGELPLGICLKTGEITEMVAFHFDAKKKKICFDNDNIGEIPEGFFCRITRKGGITYEETYTRTQAKAAGLGNVWNKHPEDMLKWRTTGKVIKFLFPDVLGGISIAEYDHNTIPDFEDTSPQADLGQESSADSIQVEIPDEIKHEELKARNNDHIEEVEIVEQQKEEVKQQDAQVDMALEKKIEKASKATEKEVDLAQTFKAKFEEMSFEDLANWQLLVGDHKGRKLDEFDLADLEKKNAGITNFITKNTKEGKTVGAEFVETKAALDVIVDRLKKLEKQDSGF